LTGFEDNPVNRPDICIVSYGKGDQYFVLSCRDFQHMVLCVKEAMPTIVLLAAFGDRFLPNEIFRETLGLQEFQFHLFFS
jgi:hypothetical protein